MIKNILSGVMLSMLTAYIQAAQLPPSSGTINFKGSIVKAPCYIEKPDLIALRNSGLKNITSQSESASCAGLSMINSLSFRTIKSNEQGRESAVVITLSFN